MKQQLNNQTKAKSQNCLGTMDVFPVLHRFIARNQSKTGLSNIFIIHNKCKGPPGLVRGVGTAKCPDPDNRHVLIKSNRTIFNIDIQIFKQIQNPNFLTFNF